MDMPHSIINKTNSEDTSKHGLVFGNGEFDAVKKAEVKVLQEVERIASDTLEEASSQFSKFAKKADAFVRKNPVTILLAVAVTGYLIARAIRRAPASGKHARAA